MGSGCHPPATKREPELAGCAFEAVSISLIIHPRNPYAPTTHANLRHFEAKSPEGAHIWWFGGGFDLTPYYGFLEDAVHWHQQAKAVEGFGEDMYPKMKAACDQYFLPHRNETRGVGGSFSRTIILAISNQTLHLSNPWVTTFYPPICPFLIDTTDALW